MGAGRATHLIESRAPGAFPCEPVAHVLRASRCQPSANPTPPPLLVTTADAIQLLQSDQNLARLGCVLRTECAGRLELIDDPCRAAVPDFELPLQQRGGRLSMMDEQLGSFAEQRVAVRRIDGGSLLIPVSVRRLAIAHDLQDI